VSGAPSRGASDWLRRQAQKVNTGAEPAVPLDAAAASKVEAWLRRHKVAYAPVCMIPMSLIDEKRSRNNQARRDPIVADSVDRFAAAFRADAVFPPIVCYPFGSRLTIIDGNNRQAAAKRAGKDAISGFIIAEDTPSEVITLLTVEANAEHGVTPDITWRIEQAHQLVSLGFTDTAAAEATAISVATLRTNRMQREAERRAKSLKIAGFDALSAMARQKLGTLKDEPVFYQAAHTAVSTAMTTEDVREMVAEVKKRTSEAAKIEYIGQVAKDRGIEQATAKAVGRAVSRVNSPKQAFVTGAGQLLKLDPAAFVRQIRTHSELKVVNERLLTLQEKVLELLVALEQATDLEEA
jgi:ParB-like chromosome segregation protein Spo0J